MNLNKIRSSNLDVNTPTHDLAEEIARLLLTTDNPDVPGHYLVELNGTKPGTADKAFNNRSWTVESIATPIRWVAQLVECNSVGKPTRYLHNVPDGVCDLVYERVMSVLNDRPAVDVG